MVYSIEDLRQRIAPVAKKYELKSVYLFGSYARQEATELSDVDILIDRTGSKIRGMLDMGGLYNDLSEQLGKEIDIITTNTLQQKSTRERTPWFIENIRTDMVKVYDEC